MPRTIPTRRASPVARWPRCDWPPATPSRCTRRNGHSDTWSGRCASPARPTEQARLLEESADAARAAGRLELAEGHLRDLVTLHAESGRPEEVARARAHLASVLLIGQRNEPALTELETAVMAIRDIGSDASGIELASQLARARMVMGDDSAGLEWAERALAGAQRLGLDAIATDLLVTRGTARFRLGEEEAGLADLRAAISQSEEAGSLNTELRARNNLAWLVVADDPRATMETARQGFELATAMGVRDMAVQLADVACAAALDTGDWDWALETVADLEQRGISAAFRLDLTSISGVIHALRGKPEPMAITDALDVDLSSIDPQVLAAVTQSRAWIAFVSGALDDARTMAMSAAAQSFGAERARQWQFAARASLWLGDRDGARAALEAMNAVGVTGRATDAARATIEAGLAALDGDPAAQDRFRAAAQSWRELDLPLQLVLCLLDAQRLGGGAPSDPAESDELLRALGADGLAQAGQPSIRSRTTGSIASTHSEYCFPLGCSPSSATSDGSSSAAWLISKISGTNRTSRCSHASRRMALKRTIASLCCAGSPKAAPLGVTV